MFILLAEKNKLMELLQGGEKQELAVIKDFEESKLIITIDDDGDWGESISVSPFNKSVIEEFMMQDIFDNEVDKHWLEKMLDKAPKGKFGGVFIDNSLESAMSDLLPYQRIWELKDIAIASLWLNGLLKKKKIIVNEEIKVNAKEFLTQLRQVSTAVAKVKNRLGLTMVHVRIFDTIRTNVWI